MISDECAKRGCKHLDALLMEYKANKVLELAEGRSMTQALWCDEHDGPFSAKDPDQRTVSSTVRDEVGNNITETYTMCGTCAARFRVGPAARVLPAAKKGED